MEHSRAPVLPYTNESMVGGIVLPVCGLTGKAVVWPNPGFAELAGGAAGPNSAYEDPLPGVIGEMAAVRQEVTRFPGVTRASAIKRSLPLGGGQVIETLGQA